jgi:hypothetical protein
VLVASIIRAMTALMMEAKSTSETSVNFYQNAQGNIEYYTAASTLQLMQL